MTGPLVIIDYGMGNLRSIQSKLQLLKVEAHVSSRENEILSAGKLILPGVGNFGMGMRNLRASGLLGTLREMVLGRRVPILGICLGMQLLTRSSEEASETGLGWVDAVTKRFDFHGAATLRVPHVGWNAVLRRRDSILFRGIDLSKRFYFSHSYHLADPSPGLALAVTEYGYEFVSALEHGNLFGTQFHPEKSHPQGLKLLENFVKYA